MKTMKITEPKTLNPILPVSKGMKVIEVGYFPMDKIISSKLGTNANRPEGVSARKVGQLENVIRADKYRPEYVEPPVLVKQEDGTYILVAGGHRHMAHENTGQTRFYAAVVEFSHFAGQSANYWKLVYQSNENAQNEDEMVSKNYRTDKGVISSVRAMIESGDITDTAKHIQFALEDQGFGSNTERGVNLLNKIRLTLGHVRGVTRIYTRNELKRVVELETTPSTAVLVRTMKDSRGFDLDYDSRLIKNIMDSYLSTKKYINVFLHWTGLNPSDILKAREIKDSVVETQYLKAKEFVEAYESGTLQNRIQIRYLPQLNGEYNVDEVVSQNA
jgi:hypothetical protein|tara:strand:- start:68 stop:1060 length:993 start_codon:yes stop_codon:yes gene_type:complete